MHCINKRQRRTRYGQVRSWVTRLKCDKPQQRKDIAQQLQVHSALFQGDPKELRQIERITATVDFKVTSYWRNKPPR